MEEVRFSVAVLADSSEAQQSAKNRSDIRISASQARGPAPFAVREQLERLTVINWIP